MGKDRKKENHETTANQVQQKREEKHLSALRFTIRCQALLYLGLRHEHCKHLLKWVVNVETEGAYRSNREGCRR